MDLEEVGCGHRLDLGIRGMRSEMLKEAVRCVEVIEMLKL